MNETVTSPRSTSILISKLLDTILCRVSSRKSRHSRSSSGRSHSQPLHTDRPGMIWPCASALSQPLSLWWEKKQQQILLLSYLHRRNDLSLSLSSSLFGSRVPFLLLPCSFKKKRGKGRGREGICWFLAGRRKRAQWSVWCDDYLDGYSSDVVCKRLGSCFSMLLF